MNPSVAVAFMTKMKLIFETDASGKPQADTFLAFQNGSFPVSKETFYFMDPAKHGLGPNETAQWMMNFDKTFNFVATVDDVITSTPDELDQVYYEALKASLPAASNRTAAQEVSYAAALAYLQQTVPGPAGHPLLMLDNYEYYDSVYKNAVSVLKNSKIAAESAQGAGAAGIQQDWAQTAPLLQHACDVALLDWETKGHKSDVEENLATFTTLAGTSPRKTIADFKSDYELFGQATALDPAAHEINYLPTQFTPVNFFEDGVPWQPMSLDKTEISSLLQKASPHLKGMFELGTSTDIENLTLEYAVVEIVRNWFHFQDFVLQRFWKLPPGAAPLADARGGGRMPAYPAKLLFVRNVSIVAPKASQVAAAGPLRLSTLLFAKAQPQAQQQLQSKAATFQLRSQLAQKQVATYRQLQAKVLSPPATHTAGPAGGIRLATMPVAARPAVGAAAAAKAGPAPATAHAGPMLNAATLPLALRASAFRAPQAVGMVDPALRRQVPIPIVPIVAQPTGAGSPVLETTTQKDMELLAFICRRLPQSPNPDPNLDWAQ